MKSVGLTIGIAFELMSILYGVDMFFEWEERQGIHEQWIAMSLYPDLAMIPEKVI